MFLMLHSLKIKTFGLVVIFFLPGAMLAETVLYKYAINLESNENKSATSLDFKKYKVSDNYKIYQTKVDLGRNKSFYRLRVGFFKSKKEANHIAKKLRSKFPKLWVDKIHKQDRTFLVKWLASQKVVKLKRNTKKSTSKRLSSSDDNEKKAKSLMLRAEQAMKDKKYRLAVGLYNKIIALNQTSHLQDAMEYLGLAREKNGQLIHAREDYRLYLKKYRKGEDSSRVRQRLISLITLLSKPRKRLKKGGSRRIEGRLYGSLLQFYRNDVFSSDQSETTTETLTTNINLLYRKKTNSLNIKSQFNANHIKYINRSTISDKERINLLFVDIADSNNKKSLRLGRQSQNKGGVIGRMDGAWIGYRLTPTWKLNLVAGYPVQTSISNIAQKNRPFWGLSADIGTIEKYWNFNAYTITQKIDSIFDRKAIGGEVRYRKDKQNHFFLFDYDIHYSELNTLFYVGNLQFNNKASVVVTMTQRNSPILTTLNATQGQTTQSIEALLLTYTESELYQIAKDRTAKYNSFSVSSTLPISKKWRFNADVTMSNLSSTTGSANVAAVEGTGNELFYSAQLIGYNVFNANETSRYQVRYDDTKSFKRTRLTASTRFKLNNEKWRLRPQITLENRINSNGAKNNIVTTGLKFDYKVRRKFKVEFDVSYEQGKTDFPVSITENNYFISAGFIWDF